MTAGREDANGQGDAGETHALAATATATVRILLLPSHRCDEKGAAVEYVMVEELHLPPRAVHPPLRLQGWTAQPSAHTCLGRLALSSHWADVHFAQGAYLVSVLHALKYPTTSVNGVLLGTFEKDGTVQVKQALPLLHSHLALAPMMDAGARMSCSARDALTQFFVRDCHSRILMSFSCRK